MLIRLYLTPKKVGEFIFLFKVLHLQLCINLQKRLFLHWWINFVTSLYAIFSFRLWVFKFFVLIVLNVNERVKGTCKFLKLKLLGMRWCVSHHWRIWELIEVWLHLQWYLWRVSDICQVVFFIVHVSVWVLDVFFNIRLWIDLRFDQSWDSLILIGILTRVIHKLWLRCQTLRLRFPLIL